jgi:hypothetical protein
MIRMIREKGGRRQIMKKQTGVVPWRQIMLLSVFSSCLALCHTALAEQVIISPDNIKAKVYQSSTAYVFGPSTDTHINLGQYCITGENNSGEAMAYCTVGGVGATKPPGSAARWRAAVPTRPLVSVPWWPGAKGPLLAGAREILQMAIFPGLEVNICN